ncbi:MAG: hypothetical protein LUQ66_08160 [Methanoregula sp.]|nr:hypothetical protein [Methanoregula sp.]
MVKKILFFVSVLLSMLILIPGVTADTSGTAPVDGNPALTMSLTVTGAHSFGDMNPGDNVNTTSNTVKATVTTNAPWAISVSDVLDAKPAGSDGKMAEWNITGSSWVAGGKVLTHAFNVGSTTDTWVPLTASSQQLWSGHAGTFEKYPFFKQTIEVADTRVAIGHNYRIVSAFTATAT